MSKFSTDELIAAIIDSHFPATPLSGQVAEAVVRKLKAADALCDAAEEATMYRNKREDLEEAIRAYKEAS